MHQNMIIETKAASKSFKGESAISDVDLRVSQGEIVAIMGPSGSGKSTLLHCLAGIIDVDEGIVSYKGKDMRHFSQKKKAELRRTAFGFIFQFGELVPELPVRDNVALPLLLRGAKKSAAYSEADKWLDIVGISNIASSYPHTISGGETQRVAIARAMAIGPDIIFADEPTGSLDSSNSKKIMDLFVRLAKQYGKTVVFVTHSEELAMCADRVIALRDGKVVGER